MSFVRTVQPSCLSGSVVAIVSKALHFVTLGYSDDDLAVGSGAGPHHERIRAGGHDVSTCDSGTKVLG